MLVRSRTTDTPVVGPTPNVAVCISSEPRATYGDKGKAAGFHPLAGGFAANPQMTTRRFPPPWSVEGIGVAFVVKDSARQQLAYVYFPVR